MIRHAEAYSKVGAVRLEMGEGYHNLKVEVTTVSGIHKVLTFSESEASWLASQLADALDARPAEDRSTSFKASILAGGRPAAEKTN